MAEQERPYNTKREQATIVAGGDVVEVVSQETENNKSGQTTTTVHSDGQGYRTYTPHGGPGEVDTGGGQP